MVLKNGANKTESVPTLFKNDTLINLVEYFLQVCLKVPGEPFWNDISAT